MHSFRLLPFLLPSVLLVHCGGLNISTDQQGLLEREEVSLPEEDPVDLDPQETTVFQKKEPPVVEKASPSVLHVPKTPLSSPSPGQAQVFTMDAGVVGRLPTRGQEPERRERQPETPRVVTEHPVLPRDGVVARRHSAQDPGIQEERQPEAPRVVAGRTPLHAAVLEENRAQVCTLLKADPTSAFVEDAEGKTPLHLAAAREDLAMLRLFGNWTQGMDRVLNNLLRDAFTHSKRELAKTLLNLREGRATLSAQASAWLGHALPGDKDLYLAVEAGDLRQVQTLIQQGACLLGTYMRVNGAFGRAVPLERAIAKGHLPMVKLLVEAGAYLGPRGVKEETSLHLAAQVDAEHVPAILAFLRSQGASLEAKNKPSQYTPLHLAAVGGLDANIRALIERGANPRAAGVDALFPRDLYDLSGFDTPDILTLLPLRVQDPGIQEERQPEAPRVVAGRTPLHAAVLEGNRAQVCTLLQADPTSALVADAEGKTPLHLAAERENLDMLRRFGNWVYADEAVTTALNNLLREAVTHGKRDLAVALRNLGAGDGPADEGGAALYRAAEAGNLRQVQTLLQQGACLFTYMEVHGDYGRAVPLEVAIAKGHLPMVKLLVEAGAYLGPRGADDITSLHLAARSEEGSVPEILAFLVSQGILVNAKRKDGITPLQDAAIATNTPAILALLRLGADKSAKSERPEINALAWYQASLGDDPAILEALRVEPPVGQ